RLLDAQDVATVLREQGGLPLHRADAGAYRHRTPAVGGELGGIPDLVAALGRDRDPVEGRRAPPLPQLAGEPEGEDRAVVHATTVGQAPEDRSQPTGTASPTPAAPGRPRRNR